MTISSSSEILFSAAYAFFIFINCARDDRPLTFFLLSGEDGVPGVTGDFPSNSLFSADFDSDLIGAGVVQMLRSGMFLLL